jgi:hypothetical protein
MKYSSWIGLAAAITTIILCFTTWIYVPSVQLAIGGMQSSGKNNFGRPGMLHLILSSVAAILFILPRTWAKRTNIFFTGLNMAWAVRNYIVLTKCYGGDCPEKTVALYLLMAAAALMLVMSLLPDLKVKNESKDR